MTDFYIRWMEMDDIPACREIVRQHWGSMIAEQAAVEMGEMFTSNSKWPPRYFVAMDDTGICGFAGMQSSMMMSNYWELIWINIRPDRMNSGLGRRLTQARLDHIASKDGTVVLLSTQNPGFFEQFGFKTIDNLDGWCLMRLQISKVTIDIDRS